MAAACEVTTDAIGEVNGRSWTFGSISSYFGIGRSSFLSSVSFPCILFSITSSIRVLFWGPMDISAIHFLYLLSLRPILFRFGWCTEAWYQHASHFGTSCRGSDENLQGEL
eukprot:SAG11_NODE_2886_length_2867_cov_1.874277_4_plen_111_part_00